MKKSLRSAAIATAMVSSLSLALASCSDAEDSFAEPSASDNQQGEQGQEQEAQVEPLPYNAGGLLSTNGEFNFADGEQGEISILKVGEFNPETGQLPFTFRNNTNDDVTSLRFNGSARDGDRLVASGNSQGVVPAQVKSGEVGHGFVYLENSEAVPENAEFEVTADSSEPVGDSSYGPEPLKITEVNVENGAIVGTIANENGKEIAGPYSVQIFCFDGETITHTQVDFADKDSNLADGETANFAAELYGSSCETYSIGASGWTD